MLIIAVIGIVAGRPGINTTEIVTRARELRREGLVSVAFQDKALRDAITIAAGKGRKRCSHNVPFTPDMALETRQRRVCRDHDLLRNVSIANTWKFAGTGLEISCATVQSDATVHRGVPMLEQRANNKISAS